MSQTTKMTEIMLISKVNRSIFPCDMSRPDFTGIDVKINDKVKIPVDIFKDKNLKLSDQNTTVTDGEVLNSVCSLMLAGKIRFTPQDVVRVMTGDPMQDITAQKVDVVKKSIEKMSMIRATIDYTDEMVLRGVYTKKDKENGRQSIAFGSLMPVSQRQERFPDGRVIDMYTLTEVPCVYIYASEVHEIATVPIEYLSARKQQGSRKKADTEDVTLIKRYLIQRIEPMKNKNNKIKSARIVYVRNSHDVKNGSDPEKYDVDKVGAFISLGYLVDTDGNWYDNSSEHRKISNWRQKKAKLHKHFVDVLEGFKDNGYITDFEVVKQGKQAVYGVDIKL